MSEQKVKVSIDSEWLLAKHEQELREQIAKEIEDFTDKGYQGILTSDDPNVLATGTYIKEALSNAVAIARRQK